VQAHGGTDIASALRRSLRHLDDAARPDALQVVLLMTDGEPSGEGQPYVDPSRLAARARGSGILIYTIGLGTNVDEDLLVDIAGVRDRYFFAPSEGDLEGIYRQLSIVVGGAVATDLVIRDTMGAEVDYVAGSATGQPVQQGTTLTWTIGAVPQGGIPPFTLRVRPRVLGRVTTNTRAVAEYTVNGRHYAFEFPVPEVLVVERPTPTPTATATATATATPTPRVTGPSTVYLPVVHSGRCPKEQRLPADVMLVVDTSSSMTGAKLAAAVAAARTFVSLFDSRQDRLGLVSFDSEAHTVGLTSELDAIARALGALLTREGTRIDLGLYEAVRELYYDGRPDVAHVAVLLTDGQPTPGTREAALAEARLLRQHGASLYTIGLGSDVDGDFLRELADSGQLYHFAPGPSDLSRIYESIAVLLPCR
jgi:Mg-chelatase subunit ChlD